METKRCSRCKQDLPLAQFTHQTSSPDGLSYYCSDCRHEQYVKARERREGRAALPYSVKIWAAVYQSNRRAKDIGVPSTLTLEEWQGILDKSGGECFYCHGQIGVDQLTIEHIIPLTKGGPNTADNVVAACSRCNGRKGNVYYGPPRFVIQLPVDGWKPKWAFNNPERIYPRINHIREDVDNERVLHIVLDQWGIGQYTIDSAWVNWRDNRWYAIYTVDRADIALLMPNELMPIDSR